MKRLHYIDKIQVSFRRTPVGTLSTSHTSQEVVFEYDKTWLAEGFSISPLELPLKSGVFKASSTPFKGNFGVFEDSMPDGYGRYLLHKVLAREGIDSESLNVLDRLALIGDAGMGALTYHPVIPWRQEENITDMDLLQRKALQVLSERQSEDASLLLYNSGNSGGARPKAILSDEEGHWLVKLRHTYDPADSGLREFEINRLARQAGLDVADFRLINDRYFASRRFDMDEKGNRLHMVTAGGLLGISLESGLIDYGTLLNLTGFITQDSTQVEEMYRRMVFNYLVDNRDDHCKNFSFRVSGDFKSGFKWRLTPAYDLTSGVGGANGEHATTVNWSTRPRLQDFLEVGSRIRMPEARCHEIISEVREALGDKMKYEL